VIGQPDRIEAELLAVPCGLDQLIVFDEGEQVPEFHA
jgi:hypothetical protein